MLLTARPQYSADWGDVISFQSHLKARADSSGVDLLVVDTGDRVEGNGLYDASTPKGLLYYDLWAEHDVDVICSGNHELYQRATADREYDTTVPNFRDKYVASNIDYVNTKGERKPLAKRYRKFRTKNQGLDVVAFGFLFDFKENANNTIVQPVAETVQEPWFQDAIREKADVFLVIGHVGLRMPEFRTVFDAIRRQNWHVPILFFGGHAHVRDALAYDSQSFAMASGRYGETLGFMSVDGVKKRHASASASLSFSRKYIDSNLYSMHHHSNKDESTFDTPAGVRASAAIARARKTLQLDYKFGCAPKTLWVNRAPYPSDDSIFSWLERDVFPAVVVNAERKDKPRLAITNTGGVRFDVFKGAFTRDSTYLVSPFVSGFDYVPDVPYSVAKRVLGLLNSADKILNMETKFLASPEVVFARGFGEQTHEEQFELRSADDDLIGGYTTKDDIGDDGDDTVHKPLKFFTVPNCIQSEIDFPEQGEPETVDLVFVDFIRPWIIPALKFSGGDYNDEDVRKYMDGTMAYKMSEWIAQNWNKDC